VVDLLHLVLHLEHFLLKLGVFQLTLLKLHSSITVVSYKTNLRVLPGKGMSSHLVQVLAQALHLLLKLSALRALLTKIIHCCIELALDDNCLIFGAAASLL